MSATTSREIRLKHRPEGLPRVDDFELAEVPTQGSVPFQVGDYVSGRQR